MRKLLVLTVVAISTLSLLAQAPSDRPFWRPVIMGTEGMVAAEHPLEAMAGMKILEGGGNAIDAAVAVFYMTTVVEQHQAGMGGDGFILAYLKEQDRVIFINGTGPAPKLATREFYEKLGGIPDTGPYSTDVPGAVGGFDLALKKYGTMDYKTLLKPAIEAARHGHPLSYWSASHHERAVSKISPFPSSVRILLRDGRPRGPGHVFVQEDLARTFETIAEEGADVFYRGRLARLSADFYKQQKGLLSYDDLSSYQAEEAEPIKTTFVGLDVYQSAPNSQGIVMLMALNILEGYDLRALGWGSADYFHLVVEALKLAFADRNHYIGDPHFVENMPVKELLSKEYAAERRKLIEKDRAIRLAPPPGDPRQNLSILDGHEVLL